VSEREDWTPDGTFLSSDGVSVRAKDEVFVIDPIRVTGQGNGGPFQIVPAGSQATVLFFTTEPPVELELECYVGDGFCFAETTAANVRFAMRIEEKYPR
jgi:hypothetical protein